MSSVFDRLGLPLIPSNASLNNGSASTTDGAPPPLVLYKNHVTDSQIVSGAVTNAALGALCLLAWVCLRGRIPFYTARLRLAAVCVRPPPQPGLGSLRQAWEWIGPTLTTSDADLARSAGLDALVTHRALTFGVLFFWPVALVGCAVLLPVYARGGVRGAGWFPPPSPAEQAAGGAAPDSLARLTLAHVPPGVLDAWLPAAFALLSIAYGCWLLDRFQAEWLLLRQLYLSVGEPVLSDWEAASGAAATAGGERRSSNGDPAAAAAAGEGEGEGGGATAGGGDEELGTYSPSSPSSSRLSRYWADTLTLVNAADGSAITIPAVAPAPFRKTLRVVGPDGVPRAVPAELYAALALDVPPPPGPRIVGRAGSWARLVSVGGGRPKQAAVNGGDAVAAAAGLETAGQPAPPAPASRGCCSGLAALGAVCGAPLRSAHTAAAAAFATEHHAAAVRLTSGVHAAAARLPPPPLPRAAPHPPTPPPPTLTTTTHALDPRAPPSVWFEAASRLGGRALVDAVFGRLCPGDYLGAVPVQDARPVHAALLAWDGACVRLEEAEKRAASAERGGRPRPTVKGAPPGDPEATRQDAAAAASASAAAAEARVLAAQQAALASADTGASSTAFFALFATQAAAAAAAAVPAFPQGWGRAFPILPAPGADEVAWDTLATPPGPRRTRDRAAGAAWLATFICLPVGIFAGAAANVQFAVCAPPRGGGGEGNSAAYLSAWSPARRAFCSPDPSLARSLLTGWLPSIGLAAWSCLAMPRALMRGCQLLRADASLSALDTRVFWCFFIWTFFNVILGGMLSGSALQTIPSAIADPSLLYNLVGSALPASSNFFISYLQTQALLMVPFRLLWPCGVPLGSLLRRLHLARRPPGSPARAATADLPHVSLRAGRELGGVAFNLFAIALAYGAVAPLALPFAALWSAGAWVVWRHQLLYVYERAWESGGAAPWRCIRAGGAWALAAHGFFTGCALVAKEAFYVGGALAVLAPIAVGAWYWRATERADVAGRGGGAPGLLAAAAPRAVPDGRAYTPPALRPRAAGWWPSVDAAWVGWGGIGPYAPAVRAAK